jgi:uncharacterized membrane protein (UPF0127 family)
MHDSSPSRRFRGAPLVEIGGVTVPVAQGFRARLLGLAHLDREDAGSGLLIPSCSGVHTFGMRFGLDLVFLDRKWRPLSSRRAVPPRRFAADRGAAAVLELPAGAPWPRVHAESGNFGAGGGESRQASSV